MKELLHMLAISTLALATLAGCPSEPVDTRHDKGYTHMDDRASLSQVYGDRASVINGLLTDDQIYVYAKSLEYALVKVDPGTVVEWEGPKGILKGKITVYPGKPSKDNCKEFTQEILIDKKVYSGSGKGCYINGHWTIKDKTK